MSIENHNRGPHMRGLAAILFILIWLIFTTVFILNAMGILVIEK